MAEDQQKITIRPHGPYLVRGSVPLVRRSQVMSEYGEPLDWRLENVTETPETYRLCRCGKSNAKPFCDNTHTLIGFDGGETADTGPISGREKEFIGEKIVVKDDHSLCVHAGFCGTRLTNVWKMIEDSADPEIRAKIIAMVEMCPSGTLTFAPGGNSDVLEPDLPKEVAVVPDGPLWVTGGIPVERRDGKPLETRNRITLCRCGDSNNKPFCDGTHKETGFTDS